VESNLERNTMTNSGMLHYRPAGTMARYEAGDYIKVEFKDERSGESEWMWVLVDSCDEEQAIVFGVLDSVPVVHGDRLHLGQELAVSFENVRDHKKSWEFRQETKAGE
jgi:hypothetical protein